MVKAVSVAVLASLLLFSAPRVNGEGSEDTCNTSKVFGNLLGIYTWANSLYEKGKISSKPSLGNVLENLSWEDLPPLQETIELIEWINCDEGRNS